MWQFWGTFQSFRTSFPSKRNFRRVFTFPQNVSSLDVRIHHRICDAQKHLLHTLVKQKKYIIENCIIYVTILRNVSILSNIFSIEEKLQESVYVSTKRILTRCESSSQNLWCSKTSTSHTCLKVQIYNWQLHNKCDNSKERLNPYKHPFDRRETSGECLSFHKTYPH